MAAVKPSDNLPQVNIPAGITPSTDASEFPTHYSDYAYGGMRTVTTIAERDAIPAGRRVDGMVVYVVGDKYYRLENGITNADWMIFAPGSGSAGAALRQISFVGADWKAQTPDDGTLRLVITHTLGTTDLNVDFYQTGKDGVVDIPWENTGVNQITACVPTGFSFEGLARFVASESTAGTVTAFEEVFVSSKFVEMPSGSGQSVADFTHNLGSNSLNFNFFLTNNCPLLICASSITATTLSIRVPTAEVFGGRVYITRT